MCHACSAASDSARMRPPIFAQWGRYRTVCDTDYCLGVDAGRRIDPTVLLRPRRPFERAAPTGNSGHSTSFGPFLFCVQVPIVHYEGAPTLPNQHVSRSRSRRARRLLSLSHSPTCACSQRRRAARNQPASASISRGGSSLATDRPQVSRLTRRGRKGNRGAAQESRALPCIRRRASLKLWARRQPTRPCLPSARPRAGQWARVSGRR